MEQTRIPSSSTRNSDRDGYVFISYKREEVREAEKIRRALLVAGFDVWWDEDIQCGEVWNEVLDDAVKRASSIVVLWSERSMKSRWVMHEASSAIDRGVYTPARIQLCTVEAPYDRLQATDIIAWDGETHHPGVEDLLRRVGDLLPLRQSLPTRIGKWFWSNVTAVASVLFAVLAMAILLWQTRATQIQIAQMSGVVQRQGNTASALQSILDEQQQAEDAASQRAGALTDSIERVADRAETLGDDLETLRETTDDIGRTFAQIDKSTSEISRQSESLLDRVVLLDQQSNDIKLRATETLDVIQQQVQAMYWTLKISEVTYTEAYRGKWAIIQGIGLSQQGRDFRHDLAERTLRGDHENMYGMLFKKEGQSDDSVISVDIPRQIIDPGIPVEFFAYAQVSGKGVYKYRLRRHESKPFTCISDKAETHDVTFKHSAGDSAFQFKLRCLLPELLKNS